MTKPPCSPCGTPEASPPRDRRSRRPARRLRRAASRSGAPGQRALGTSGHRGSALDSTFNDDHIAAITQAIVEFRVKEGIGGPVILGKDTHASSERADRGRGALRERCPGPHPGRDGHHRDAGRLAGSRLQRGRRRRPGRAAASSSAPTQSTQDGGFKYNPPDGDPPAARSPAGSTTGERDLEGGLSMNPPVCRAAIATGRPRPGRGDRLHPPLRRALPIIDVASIRGRASDSPRIRWAALVPGLGGARGGPQHRGRDRRPDHRPPPGS